MVANYVEAWHLTARKASLRENRLPRFFFHLECENDILRDEEGVVADDAEVAIQQSLAAVEEMRVSGELPALSGDWTLVVSDEHGKELRRIPV